MLLPCRNDHGVAGGLDPCGERAEYEFPDTLLILNSLLAGRRTSASSVSDLRSETRKFGTIANGSTPSTDKISHTALDKLGDTVLDVSANEDVISVATYDFCEPELRFI